MLEQREQELNARIHEQYEKQERRLAELVRARCTHVRPLVCSGTHERV